MKSLKIVELELGKKTELDISLSCFFDTWQAQEVFKECFEELPLLNKCDFAKNRDVYFFTHYSCDTVPFDLEDLFELPDNKEIISEFLDFAGEDYKTIRSCYSISFKENLTELLYGIKEYFHRFYNESEYYKFLSSFGFNDKYDYTIINGNCQGESICVVYEKRNYSVNLDDYLFQLIYEAPLYVSLLINEDNIQVQLSDSYYFDKEEIISYFEWYLADSEYKSQKDAILSFIESELPEYPEYGH